MGFTVHGGISGKSAFTIGACLRGKRAVFLLEHTGLGWIGMSWGEKQQKDNFNLLKPGKPNGGTEKMRPWGLNNSVLTPAVEK